MYSHSHGYVIQNFVLADGKETTPPPPHRPTPLALRN